MEGTNIRQAMIAAPIDTKKIILKGLIDLVKFVDANKTIAGDDQLKFTLESLIDEFPALTVEDFLLVFANMKKGIYGKYYERLKLPEIVECIKKYEGEQRAEFLEAQHQAYKKQEENEPFDRVRFYSEGMEYQKKKKAIDDAEREKEANYRKERNRLYIESLKNQKP